ncbi:MAG: FHA domain-containing protein [Gammaproteobacteria bacterium]|nr:FHA domain-containing protein [Gammaproteobacteria bacterium]
MAQVTHGTNTLTALFDGREYVLGRHRLILGGDPSCEIQVVGAEVAARHAMIITLLDSAFIEDLGTEVGTYINGRQIVQRTRLENGDCIGIGCHEFQYQCDRPIPEDHDDFIGLATGTGPRRRLQPRSGLKFGRLTVLTGPARGRGFDIIKPRVTVGRSHGDVATIRRDPGGFVLLLCTPSEVPEPGPVVNGKKAPGTTCLLHDGDVIEMAGVELEFVEIF